ncbi:MAG: hypothetical protein RR945_04470 [Erysipelotrichaceae bacterium]
MDDELFEVLTQMNLNNVVLVSLNDFESPELLALKNKRTRAEYCWTCTPSIIKYVFAEYKVSECVYLDADLFFFSDPETIYNDLKDDVIIVDHRLPKTPKWQKIEKENGRFCVEFNYFNNSENSQVILDWWVDACIKWCFARNENGKYGDQKYLENIYNDFNRVKVENHKGVGVAPWNICDYILINNDNFDIDLKYNNEKAKLIFYHFASIRYITNDVVNISTNGKNKNIKVAIYYPYLKLINQIRVYLKHEYNIDFEIKKSYSNNLIRKFLQKYLRQFKINSKSDIVFLKKI